MGSARRAGLVAGVLLLVAAGFAWAQSGGVPPSMMQHLRWRSIGPFRGGRVLTVQGAPDRKARFYFGAVNGGVWRTDDAGRTWQPIFDDAPAGSIGALAIAPSAPETLYVGTGEADMRSDIAQGVGLFRSIDGGAHWAPAGLPDTRQIGRILVDPRDARTLLVAALGHPYGPNGERGVFRSTDGGATWTKTLFHDADTGAIDLAAAPDNPDVVYAALWQTRRPPWNVYPPSSGPGSGLYKSGDGGRSWVQLTGHGLPASPGRIGLATTPARPGRVYALVDVRDGGDGAGLYRSDDSGATWKLMSGDKRITERAWYFSGITADPKNADVVYVCDTVLLRSDDGGAHFVALKGDETGDDYHSLWLDPADPDRRILGVDQGALVSLNGGVTWSSWFNQPTGQFYHVSTDNRFPYRVYGAQQDSGAAAVDSRHDGPFDGIGMSEFHESAAGGESDNIAPDPDDPQTVYGGRVDRLDLRTGQMRDIDPTLAFPDAYRGTWTLPLAFGPDRALYFGNQRIFRTDDGGAHWQPISPDLTRPDPPAPASLDMPTLLDVMGVGRRRGVVYAIAPSKLDKGLIWAGTDDGLVWRTRDGGAHWNEVTPPGLGAWSKVGVIEPSPFDVDTAYLAVDRHRLDDQAPYLYRTRDGGAHWARIDASLPMGAFPGSANVVRADPGQRGLLFAGTEHGASVSFDDGDHWQDLQSGLPRTSVRDMVIHGEDLVIATHGRGFYILDDIAALRALAGDAGGHGDAAARLFPPADAIRVHPPLFTGTPMPKDEPAADNPPIGAVIDFALPAAPRGPVVLTVTDGQGRVARRFSSADPAKPLDPATLPVAPEWVPAPVRPETSPGSHRLVWDLRYEKPALLQDGDPPPQGVMAPPGRYDVALTVDGQTWHQKLRVVPDPRLHLADADFQAEFDMARAVEAARVACRAALRDAGQMRPKLATEAARQSLDALIDAPARGVAAHAPSPTGLSSISDRLDKLAQAVDGADAAPTPDARAGLRQAQDDLARTQSRLAALRPVAKAP